MIGSMLYWLRFVGLLIFRSLRRERMTALKSNTGTEYFLLVYGESTTFNSGNKLVR